MGRSRNSNHKALPSAHRVNGIGENENKYKARSDRSLKIKPSSNSVKKNVNDQLDSIMIVDLKDEARALQVTEPLSSINSEVMNIKDKIVTEDSDSDEDFIPLKFRLQLSEQARTPIKPVANETKAVSEKVAKKKKLASLVKTKRAASAPSSPIVPSFDSLNEADFDADLEKRVTDIVAELNNDNGSPETKLCTDNASKTPNKKPDTVPSDNLQIAQGATCNMGQEVHAESDILKGVVAYISAWVDKKESISDVVAERLQFLGAEVVAHMSRRVTHLVFKEGRTKTYENALKRGVKAVSVSWVEACRKQQAWVPEETFVPCLAEEKKSDFGTPRGCRRKQKNSGKIPATSKGSSPLANAEKETEPFEMKSVSSSCPPTLQQTSNDNGESVAVTPNLPVKQQKKMTKKHLFKRLKKDAIDTPRDSASENKDFEQAATLCCPGQNGTHNHGENLESIPKNKARKEDSNIKKMPNVFQEIQNLNNNTPAADLPESTPNSLEDFVVKSKGKSSSVKKHNWHDLQLNPKINSHNKNNLVLTNMDPKDCDAIVSVVQTLGKFTVAPDVDNDTTHVICGSKKRTLKVLFGLTRGCWLLSPEWIFKSLEAGKWLAEESYELKEYYPAVQVSRQERLMTGSSYKQELFKNEGFIYVSPIANPPQRKLEELIAAAGGCITTCYRRCKIVIGPIKDSPRQNKMINPMNVAEKWILDCISHHKILPIESYKVQEV